MLSVAAYYGVRGGKHIFVLPRVRFCVSGGGNAVSVIFFSFFFFGIKATRCICHSCSGWMEWR